MEIYQRPPGLCYHNTGNEKQTGEPSNHQTKKRFAEIKNSAALVLHDLCLEKYTYFSFGNLEILMIKVICLFLLFLREFINTFLKFLL